MTKFNQITLSKGMQKSIKEMGFSTPTPIQEAAIPKIIQKLDITAQAQTGTGKTLAFAIPMVEMLEQDETLVQVLVLCPTRELARQTADQIKLVAAHHKWIKALPIYGGQALDRQITALKKKPQIVIGTPGRLMDLIDRKRLKLHGIKMVVLDEADEMLSMGFQKDIDEIIKKMPKYKQTLMFSATMSKEILKLSQQYQMNPQMIKMPAKELTVATIEQFSFQTQNHEKFNLLTRIVNAYNLRRTLVFCNTRLRAAELTKNLRMRGYVAEVIHGEIKQYERNKVISRFKEGNTTLLIATDVAARGIDIQDIDAVINYDLPHDIEYYVHRIGRTGRAGKKGASYSFATEKDAHKLREIQRYTKAEIIPIEPPNEIDMEKKIMSELINKATRALKKRKYSDYIDDVQKILDSANNSEDEQATFTATELSAALLHIIATQPAGRIKPESKPQRNYNKPKKSYGKQGKSYGNKGKSYGSKGKTYDKSEKGSDSGEKTYGKQGKSYDKQGKSYKPKGKSGGYNKSGRSKQSPTSANKKR